MTYLFSYFRSDEEALFLATSSDGYRFEAANGGEAVLAGEVGAESLRDPFLCRDGAGTFHLLATDGWESDAVVHATSPDCRTWSDQERLPVMGDVPGTRNAWAPEAVYERETDRWRLFWSSTVSETGPEDLLDHRIWTATTPDFEAFADPEVMLDPGYSVIDATVRRRDGAYHLAVKDERGANDLDTDYKAVRTAVADRADGPWEGLGEFVTPAPVEGPTLYRADGDWLLLYDHFVEGRYGASRSADFETWTVVDDEVTVPEGARHGSVLEVPDGAVAWPTPA